MGNNVFGSESFLKKNEIEITENLSLHIPTISEILDNEENYYSIVSAFTGTPFQYMVFLDSIGVDYSTATDYELFIRLFLSYKKEKDLSIFFGNINTNDFELCLDGSNNMSGCKFVNEKDGIVIDEFVYYKLAAIIRKINVLQRDTRRPGNDESKRYELEKAKRKYERDLKKTHSPILEPMVIALVNRPEFKYDYNTVMDLSIYKFSQSFKQIETSIKFENTMRGIYAGTIDISKIQDKSSLSWIQQKMD